MAMVLPIAIDMWIARLAGRALWLLYRRGRTRAIENLKASFPDKDRVWINSVGRRSFEQIAMLGMDVILTQKIVRKDNWRRYSTFKHVERVKWMMKEGRGLILVTGHYGNFEIIGYMFSLFGFQLYSIARPLDNRFVDRWLRSIRERHGQRIIDKKGAADMMPSLPSSVSIGMIADQDAGRKGIFVDFFGRPASTFKSIALLAVTRQMPVVVGYGRRIGNRFFFEIGVTRIIFPDQWQDKDDPVRWVTVEFTKAIEQFVREDPTQYWWVHRRWKTRPRGQAKGPAAVGLAETSASGLERG
jgi:KDO2-lipid IV(A) lauroyltransferase